MSDRSINNLSTSDNSLAPWFSYIGIKTRVKFGGGCSKQDKVIFNWGKTVNLQIVYEMNFWNFVDSSDPTLENSLSAVKLVKKMLISKNTSILDMILDLIWKELFHFVPVDLVKM